MIYVNGRFLLQNQTGVNRFAYEICRAWTAMGIHFTLCCPPGDIKECYDTSDFNIIVCGWGKSHIWEQFFLPYWFARIKGKKLLICFTGLAPILARNKIMTIHDLAFMVNPSWYSKSYLFLYRILTPICAATSLKILTVSESSKKEIMQRLSIKEDKIKVVYNAVASFFYNSENDIIKTNEKYILAVSSIDPRKNFTRLLKSLAYVENENIKLYVVGGQNTIYSTSVKKLNKNILSERVKWLGRVSDKELKQYYINATCFVYPSLYEGFGIPPLEAMACGTPTIVSAIPSIEEVCKDASLYINPYDEKDIADKINILLRNEDLQRSLVGKGYKRYVKFNWRKSASLLAEEVKEYFD